jgi:FkbM family methyltransferase
MFKLLRKLRHKKEIKNLFIWNFLGQFYRFLIKLLPFNFYINQKITNSFNFRLHSFFAFSNFNEWGNRHNKLFQTYIELCKKSKCFFDIGAHIGLVSLPASTVMENKGIVYSFEASPKNLFFLKYHIEINNIKNIKVVEKLVSSENKIENNFFESKEPSGMNSIINLKNKRVTKYKKVQSISLDNFCKKNNIIPELIKVDIEGSEIKMLIGSKKIIKKYKPIIFLSYHPEHIKKLGYSKKRIFQILKELRYQIFDSNGMVPRILNNNEYLLVPTNYNVKKILNEEKV